MADHAAEEPIEPMTLAGTAERDPTELCNRVRKMMAYEGAKPINDEDYLSNREGYKIFREDKIANGKFAQYYRARTAAGVECVVKVLPLNNLPTKYKESLTRQGTKILRYLRNHPFDNVVGMIDIYISKAKLYVFCETLGPDLERLAKKKAFKEPEIKNWIMDILKGLQFLYEQAIGHRTITAGNIVLTADKAHAKLTGFGMAMIAWNPETGQPIYAEKEKEYRYHAPPECTKGEYDVHIADIWGVGCIVSNLMTKRYCFEKKTTDFINAFKSHFRRYEVPISGDLDCFLSRIFLAEPTERAGLPELMHHHWFGGGCPHGHG